MYWLRFILFLGLVTHKAVWEILKRRNGIKKAVHGQKDFFTRIVKICKVLLMLFFMVQTLFLNVLPISGMTSGIRAAGAVVFLLGLLIAVIARIELGRNWVDLEEFQILPQQSLVTRGLYSYIRHPIYAGDLLLLLGLQIALGSWLIMLVGAVFVVVLRQALAEEALLVKVFPEYSEYCARTSRFIPFLL